MRLKTILAKNMPEGMRRVREQLGPNAVIVQTEETDGGVLIMAAVDPDHLPPPPLAATLPSASRPPRMPAAPLGPGLPSTQSLSPALPPPAPPPPAARPENPPGILPWRELPADPAEAISDALDFHRVPASVSASLLSTAQAWDFDDPVPAMTEVLRARFIFQPLDPLRAQRPILLIGPPGAGKTIGAAKLAMATLIGGGRPGLICADTGRAGGPEQLQAFAAALRLDMVRAGSVPDLRDALLAHGAARPVIIDGPALNPLEAQEVRIIRELAAAADAEPLLLLPAGLDAAEAEDLAATCRELGTDRFIATRLDASRRLGALLSAAAAGLAFAAFGASRKVADGFRPADPAGLARALINGAQNRMPTVQRPSPQRVRR
jgi:flagellar biosynthesis protein FlhF